jgi:hypothetical protein
MHIKITQKFLAALRNESGKGQFYRDTESRELWQEHMNNTHLAE